MALAVEALQLAPLPAPLTDSPLGSKDGLTGTRVLYRTPHRDRTPDRFLVESADGRTARFTADRRGERPWALWSPPEGATEDIVLTDARTSTGIRAYAADGALLWELKGPHSPRQPREPSDRRITQPGGVALPPAFWYLLRTRDAAGSRALRTVRPETAEALLTAALDGTEAVRAAVARELPGVTDAMLVETSGCPAGRTGRRPRCPGGRGARPSPGPGWGRPPPPRTWTNCGRAAGRWRPRRYGEAARRTGS
ncbi:hypothetical protein EF908_29295 [Streptomyces sp. WAC04770]|nr:hypothetical protein EF908_29295 [Streptomyces sp. WAC04770]